MNDYQFEFEGIRWGLHLPISTTGDGFDPGEDGHEGTDGAYPYDNARAFGRDAWTPGDWVWEVHTDDAGTATEALRDMSTLETVWRAAQRSRKVGDVRELRYQVAGRERLVYGRPGQWKNTLGGLHYGFIEAQFSFRRADLNFYDAEPRSTMVTMAPAVPNGIVAPIVAPITTLAGASRVGVLDSEDVGGVVEAPFTATITAGTTQLSSPVLRGAGWKVALDLVIPAGSSITIDTRPWSSGVRNSDGGYLNGALTADSRLSKARLNPEGEALFFDGIDSSGTSTCSVQWRPTYRTI